MKHYLQSATNYIFRSRPFDATIFLTSACNFKCDHCFYWKNLNTKDQLTLEEFKTLARSMPHIERLQFTGGEPFVRNDIDEIVREFYISSRPRYITIPTNGHLTDRIVGKTESILKTASDCFVNVSLQFNELGEKRDEMVKVKGSFDRLIQTIKGLKKLQSKFTNFGVTVICIQTTENEDRLQQIYEYAEKELKVDNFGFSIVRGDPKCPDLKNADPEIYYNMCQKLLDSYKEKHVGSRIPLYKLFLTNREYVYDYTYKTLVQNSYQLKCFAGILRLVIRENGDVYPCEILMDEGTEFRIGNLRDCDMDFMKLWKSKERKNITRQINEQKCFCIHGCDMLVNTLFSRKFPFQVMKKLFS